MAMMIGASVADSASGRKKQYLARKNKGKRIYER
jgi:hypothetical protein